MLNESYYISLGAKDYFYTLRHKYQERAYLRNPNGGVSVAYLKDHDYFVRVLSHNFDEAISKAKQLLGTQKSSLLAQPDSALKTQERSDAQRMAFLENMILPSGKYTSQHVSEAPKSYVKWVVTNLFNPDVGDDKNKLLGLICYRYADEQGWVDQWVADGLNQFHRVFEQAAAQIDAGKLLFGQFKGKTIDEFLFNNGKINERILASICHRSEYQMGLEVLLDFESIEPRIDEQGRKIIEIPYQRIANAQLQAISDDYINILVARNQLAELSYRVQLSHIPFVRDILSNTPDDLLPIYRMVKGDVELPFRYCMRLQAKHKQS